MGATPVNGFSYIASPKDYSGEHCLECSCVFMQYMKYDNIIILNGIVSSAVLSKVAEIKT